MSKIINNRVTPSGEPVFSAYLHHKGRQLGIPVSGTFELTSRCNFSCKMCYIHSSDCNKNKEYELSADEWIKLGEKARDAGMIFLLLTGGEPLIREDFPLIYKKLNSMGFIISINTNGSLITDEIIELFREYTPGRVNVSLYGASDETYRSLCSSDSYEKVISNIKKLKETGIQVKLNVSITPDNCRDTEEIYRFAADNDLKIKATTYMYPPVRNDILKTGVNEGRFSPYESAVYKVKYERMKYDEETFLSRADAMRDGILRCEEECIDLTCDDCGMQCRAGTSAFWINWKGDMSSCGMIPDSEFNVREKDFNECWQGVRAKALKVRLPMECQRCKYRNYCFVCAAACKSETGAYDKKPEYLCSQSKFTAQLMEKEAKKLRGEKNGY